MAKREQISVPLDRDLREFVERTAAREHRTVANLVRHLIAEAHRKSEVQTSAEAA